MPRAMLGRFEALCLRLDTLIEPPPAPALVHGDIWASNLLAQNGRITGVLDPAIYYGHPEVELAYIFLFHSFGQPFCSAIRICDPYRLASSKNASTSTSSIRC